MESGIILPGFHLAYTTLGKLTAENPTKSFFVMELTEEDAQKRMEELEAEHKGMLAAVHVDNTNGDKRKFTIFHVCSKAAGFDP